MTTQTRDPQPLGRGGETAAVAIGGAGVLLGVAALAGLGLAGALLGGGWVWPASLEAAGPVLGGLISGDPGRGLPAAHPGHRPPQVGRHRLQPAAVPRAVVVHVPADHAAARYTCT